MLWICLVFYTYYTIGIKAKILCYMYFKYKYMHVSYFKLITWLYTRIKPHSTYNNYMSIIIFCPVTYYIKYNVYFKFITKLLFYVMLIYYYYLLIYYLNYYRYYKIILKIYKKVCLWVNKTRHSAIHIPHK